MRPIVLLATAALAACGDGEPEPFALVEPLACGAGDVIGLEGGLHAHLLESRDGGATFDYAPDRPLEAKVRGTYDRVGGDFAWVLSYDDGVWRTEEDVDGAGTAYPDGDLDVAYTRKTKRVVGAALIRDVRVVRAGCDQDVTESWGDGRLVSVEHGTYGKAGYAYTVERARDGAVTALDGLLRWNRRRTEHEAWRVGDHEYVADREDDGAGNVEVAYREVVDGVVFEGTVTQKPSGDERHVFTQTDPGFVADWDYRLSVRGDGTGTVTFSTGFGEPLVCDVGFDDGACDLDCPGGGLNDCGLP